MRKSYTAESVYKSLQILDALYQRSMQSKHEMRKAQHEMKLFCKLSVIEFCGWVEVTIDEVVQRYISKKITNSALEKDATVVLNHVYGCDPETDIQKILINIIGYSSFQHYAHKYSNEWAQIKRSINNIGGRITLPNSKTPRLRDIAAHSNYDMLLPAQNRFASPSVAIYEFKLLFPALKGLRSHILQY